MSASAPDADQTTIGSGPKESAPASVSWGGRQKTRGNVPLKLLGALRGAGMLVWSDGSAPAAYELDIYGRGETRTASGNLEGDFSGILFEDEARPQPGGYQLRLDDGRDLQIELTFMEAAAAGFEARETPANAEVLSKPGS